MQATICIIEDNQELRKFLSSTLQSEGYIVYSAESGLKGLDLVEVHEPELVLLDIDLPDIDGKTICQKIKKSSPHVSIIFVTAHDASREIVTGLDLGANDYITKPIDIDELLARIRVNFRSSQHAQPVLQIDDLSLNQNTHEVKRGDTQIELSAQEFRLLQYLLINKGRVLSRSMILARIWEGSPEIQTRVVDVYIGYLRKKIDFKKPHLIHTVRGFGYTLRVDK